jgi:AraC-like DNA-binding protein
MSIRTFIRRLKNEGTSYQTLVDEVRREIASWLIRDKSLSVERVAERLGYQDTSNFSRVFKRWFNDTPSAYRKRL